MQLNLTTVLLLSILGFVAFKLVTPMQPAIGSGATSPSSNPVSGRPSSGQQQPDLFSQILGTVTSIMGAVDSVAQASVKTTS